MRRFELIVNISTLLAALMLCATLIRMWFPGANHIIAPIGFGANTTRGIIGTSVAGLSNGGPGAIFYLSPSCRFCRESLPFYRALLGSFANSDFSFSVVMLEGRSAATEFIKANRLAGAVAIDPATLKHLNLRSTPRVLIHDSAGKIKRAWTGRLSAEKEAEVRAALNDLSER